MDKKEAIYYLQYLRHDVHADSPYDVAIVTAINALSETKPPKTNADRIRQMTDEELAEFLSAVKNYCIKIPCGKCDFYDAESSVDDIICNPLYWLKQEVREDAGTD